MFGRAYLQHLSLSSNISYLEVFEKVYDKCLQVIIPINSLLAYLNKLFGELIKTVLINKRLCHKCLIKLFTQTWPSYRSHIDVRTNKINSQLYQMKKEKEYWSPNFRLMNWPHLAVLCVKMCSALDFRVILLGLTLICEIPEVYKLTSTPLDFPWTWKKSYLLLWNLCSSSGVSGIFPWYRERMK